MKRVITYGTFDLLHNGHISLLKRAKELGDYLIVGVTTDNYDKGRGKLNVQNDLMKRIEDVRNTGFADKIIIEEYFGQKIEDIQKYKADIFAIGSDWLGQFDYLKEFCQVVYLERTKGVSSTILRNEFFKIINLGIIGSDQAAERLMKESKYVSGIEVVGVLNPESISCMGEIEKFSRNVDAVYIGKSQLSMKDCVRTMLDQRKHVLFEEPCGFCPSEMAKLYHDAEANSLVLLEAVNIAYCPGFLHLVNLIKSKKIGEVRDVSLFFPELSAYALLPIIKLLGEQYDKLNFYCAGNETSNALMRGVLQYSSAFAAFKVGTGAKSESSLTISGTKGYAYVPEPWWRIEFFELRFEDQSQTEKYFYKLLGDGSRYVIQEFVKLIHSNTKVSSKLLPRETVAICSVMEKFYREKGFQYAKS